MKTLRKKLLFSIAFVVGTIVAFSQTTENSYVVNQEVAIGGSSLFYVPISGVPNGATITNVEAKFDYIAYGVVQNYVSCRFNKDSDPGTGGGVVLVSLGNLPPGNPGTFGYYSFSNWNGQTGINTNYYFRFSLASGSPYTCTINNIYVRVTYIQPSLAITAPNGGETWYVGTDYTITWNSSDVTGNIQIDLYKNDSNILQLAANAPNTGTYPFNPPGTLTDGSDYKIGISAMSGTVSDFSDNNFTIISQATPTLTVTAPNGGETWYVGTDYTITWNSSNITGNIQIDLYKNGSNILQLAANAPNTGTYPFNPPGTLTDGSDYKIGISAMSGTVSDFSDNNYSIINSSQNILPPILISPLNGGSLMGPPFTFIWQGVSGAGAYQIKIADNTSFNNPLVNDLNISGNTTSFQTNATLNYGQSYYWQMRTLNSSGTTWGSWGQYQIFIVSNSTSDQPIDDYPAIYKNSTKCCEPNGCVDDAWKFYSRECTSFVCWRINRDLGYTQLQSTDPFRNLSVFGQSTHLGDAKFWADVLQGLNLNIQVDNIPRVGDIAHWDSYIYGHVAYVQSVNSDNTVNIEEYNFSNSCQTMGLYSYRENITAQRYIHIRDGNGGGSSIREQNLSYTFMIYPNPAKSFLNIAFSNSVYLKNCKILVFNSFGELICSIPITELVSTINTENFISGIYLILIEIDGKIETHKMIKE